MEGQRVTKSLGHLPLPLKSPHTDKTDDIRFHVFPIIFILMWPFDDEEQEVLRSRVVNKYKII